MNDQPETPNNPERHQNPGLAPYSGIEIEIDVEPVRHKSNKTYREFIDAFRQSIKPQSSHVFTGDVLVSWTLYHDERMKLETDRIADLDNLVKGLNDAIKGPDGLLIDDSQIQSLQVSWLPMTPGRPHIRLRIEDPIVGAIPKPIRVYEGADELFYPITAYDVGDERETLLLQALRRNIVFVDKMCAVMHGEDYTPDQRFYFSTTYGQLQRGFMKTRVMESGFEIVPFTDWNPRVPEESTSGAPNSQPPA
ncbi:RusA family crossover junction endodeoxyribonuclease [Rhodococcus gordoniae]